MNTQTLTESADKKKYGSAKKCRYEKITENGVFCFIVSFFIPFFIMLCAFAYFGVHPFGQRQMLVVDLWHQYFPFFRVVREKLAEGGSFMYSWENGLGTNFLSLISYYAASPLNWIAVLFDESRARDVLMFLLCAKSGFCSAFFSCFLRYTYKRKDMSVCMFSSMFALSSYFLGYYWNVMWFDTIALFPLVMLGVVAVCREGKWKTYTFSLAFSLISNYYIGYFTCVFTVFMFIASGIIEFRGIKQWLVSFVIMIRSTILAVCLGGFMLMPAYFGLKLTYSVKNSMPKATTVYSDWKEIFANLLSYNPPVKVEGLPNLACGMLALVLFGVFFFSKGIKIREKLASTSMLAVIAVSCNINKLNFIFHGFHFTNQIPYRFAFIWSFVIAAAAFRAYDVLMSRGIKPIHFLFMLICPVTVFALNFIVKGKPFLSENSAVFSAVITAAFIIIFASAKLFPFKSQKVRNSVLSLGLTLAVVFECVCNAVLGVKTVDTTNFNEYPSKNAPVQTLLEDLRMQDDSLFYRLEMTGTYTLNDSALYGYYGISQFSSSANVSVTRFMKRLGLYASEAGNRYCYRLTSPVVNSLLGLKYIISKNGSLETEELALSHRNVADKVHLYENNYPLSLGFMMNSDILNMPDSDGSNPFEYQNELIKRATGIEQNLYKPQNPSSIKYTNMETSKNGFGNYAFRAEDENKGLSSAEFTFKGIDGAYLYGYSSCTQSCIGDLTVKCGDATIDNGDLIKSYPLVFPMGNAQKGEYTTVTATSREDKKSGNFKVMAYSLDTKLFKKAYDELADEQFVISQFSDTKINGAVSAEKDGVLFLSIPYESGWKVYVDGKKAETFPVLQSMLGVNIEEGRHDIRIVYSPEGFGTGLLLSVVSFLFIILVIFMDKKYMEKTRMALYDRESDEYYNSLVFEDADETSFIVYRREEEKNAESESDDII